MWLELAAARRASTGLEGTGRRPRSGRRTRGGTNSVQDVAVRCGADTGFVERLFELGVIHVHLSTGGDVRL